MNVNLTTFLDVMRIGERAIYRVVFKLLGIAHSAALIYSTPILNICSLGAVQPPSKGLEHLLFSYGVCYAYKWKDRIATLYTFMLQLHSLLTRIDVKLSDAAQHIIQYIHILLSGILLAGGKCYIIHHYHFSLKRCHMSHIEIPTRNHNNNAINKQYNDIYSIIFLQTN